MSKSEEEEGGKKWNPHDLITLFEIPTEDTMREFTQTLKIAYNKSSKDIWIYIDRKHKLDPKLNRPPDRYASLGNVQILTAAQMFASTFYTMENMPADLVMSMVLHGLKKTTLPPP